MTFDTSDAASLLAVGFFACVYVLACLVQLAASRCVAPDCARCLCAARRA